MDLRIRRARDIGTAERSRLFGLHASFFDNARRESFDSDFLEKDYAITAYDSSRPVAFSTIKTGTELVGDERVSFIFSGDTIVHPDYWRENCLVPAFAAFLKRSIEESAGPRLYWFLITKGVRTYMFLPVLFETFYPGIANGREAANGPEAHYKAVLDALASSRFGSRYDQRSGIISAGGEHDYLNAQLAKTPEARSGSRHAAFFLERNPGYVHGDELACITEVAYANIKPIGRRLLESEGLSWEL